MEFYRYEVTFYNTVPILELVTFVLLRETKCGYWISPSFLRDYNNLWKEQYKRWIPKKSKKRYAYPTKKEALVNYIKRSKMRLQYLERDIHRTTSGISQANRKLKQLEDENIVREVS